MKRQTGQRGHYTRIIRLRYLPWFICFCAAFFYLYEYLLRVMPSVMMEDLRAAYHLDASALGNLSALYYYIYIPMQLFVGLIIDRFTPRRLLTAALILCSAGSFLFGVSHVVWLAGMGRFLVGFGSAFAFVGALKLASVWLPQRFAIMAGLITAMGMLGGLLGDLLLSKLVLTQGWRLTCYIMAGVGILLALFIFVLLGDAQRRVGRRHYRAVLLPTLKEGAKGLFELVRHTQIWVNCLLGCLMFLPISGFAESWGIRYLIAVDHLSSDKAALASGFMFLGFAMGAPVMGWFADILKQRQFPMTVGAAGASITLSVVLFVPHLQMQYLFFTLFLCGFFSSAQVLVFAISRELAGARYTATAVALTNMVTMLAGFSVWLIGVVINFTWSGMMLDGLRIYTASSYQLAISIIPLGLLIAVFLTFYLRDTVSVFAKTASSVSDQPLSSI